MKVLFVMPNLREGGAEKVLVNLVNNLDKNKFDVSIRTVFAEGVNIQFIQEGISFSGKFPRVFRGNKHIMKLFAPSQLYKFIVGVHEYDVVIAYLEGPATRIVSGCLNKKTKLVAWVHVAQYTLKNAMDSYRNEKELRTCYGKFNKVIAVSDTVKNDMLSIFNNAFPVDVIYNTNESKKIMELCQEPISTEVMSPDEFNIISVGRVVPVKGFDRLAKIHKRLKDEGYLIHTYILGMGPQRPEIEKFIKNHNISDTFTFLGYDTNPYKYVTKSDLFVCASHTEGFSTAATEALIVGTPVCTVEVSGMKEMLGENNEYGIVTDNDDEGLYRGIKRLLDDPQLLNHYKEKAIERGKMFSTENTVKAVEEMLLSL